MCWGVDDKFSTNDKFKLLSMTNLGKDAVYNFINNMLEKSEYCRYT